VNSAHPVGREYVGKSVWILTFESSDVVHVGGLGQAVATLAHALADLDIRPTILMPSHGQQYEEKIRKKLKLEEISEFKASGARRGVDGNEYPYSVGFERGKLGGVTYLLAKGLDPASSRWLEDHQVYDHDLTFEKMALFSRAVAHFLNYSIENELELPDLIHMNDWHTVPAGAILKQVAAAHHKDLPLAFTIHLLSFKRLPWHYISEAWCGLEDMPYNVMINGSLTYMSPKKLWEEWCEGSFEKFGALWSDWLATVSRSYLTEDVIGYVGSWVKERCGFIYNGCDWKEDEILKEVSKTHRLPGRKITRKRLRNYLLTEALEKAGPPSNADQSIAQLLMNFRNTDLFGDSGQVRNFDSDGELVLMTGRLNEQKGVDLLVKAIPDVLKVLPEVRFILILLPGQQSGFLSWVLEESSKLASGVRIVPGTLPSIYKLAYLGADVFAMPSRWEPFGIAALEAMSTGTPVVGSKVGGLKETVLDLREEPEQGTGLLVRPGDSKDLAAALAGMILMVRMADESNNHIPSQVAEFVTDPTMLDLILDRKCAFSKIRENCKKRVDTYFRPANSARMALNTYAGAQRVSGMRFK